MLAEYYKTGVYPYKMYSTSGPSLPPTPLKHNAHTYALGHLLFVLANSLLITVYYYFTR